MFTIEILIIAEYISIIVPIKVARPKNPGPIRILDVIVPIGKVPISPDPIPITHHDITVACLSEPSHAQERC